MSTNAEQQRPRERTVLYIVAIVVLVVLGVWAVVAFGSAREAERAEEKAAELVQTLEAGGSSAPPVEVIARVLGDDGGAVCANPNETLSRTTLFGVLATGAGSPGERPRILEENLLRGQLAIMQVYCPDEVEQFQEFVDSLYATTTNG